MKKQIVCKYGVKGCVSEHKKIEETMTIAGQSFSYKGEEGHIIIDEYEK